MGKQRDIGGGGLLCERGTGVGYNRDKKNYRESRGAENKSRKEGSYVDYTSICAHM